MPLGQWEEHHQRSNLRINIEYRTNGGHQNKQNAYGVELVFCLCGRSTIGIVGLSRSWFSYSPKRFDTNASGEITSTCDLLTPKEVNPVQIVLVPFGLVSPRYVEWYILARLEVLLPDFPLVRLPVAHFGRTLFGFTDMCWTTM